MKHAYWAALVVGILIVTHAVLVGAFVTVFRLTTDIGPMECRPEGWWGFGCGGPATSPGFLLEATLPIRVVIGVFLIWAFLRYRRETTDA